MISEIELLGLLPIKGPDTSRRVYGIDGIAPTLRTRSGGMQEVKVLDGISEDGKYRVRKLTPKEYGRLQGFPVDDGFEQVVSDTQSYKQFGNSVTVPVVRAIAEKIGEHFFNT